MARVVAELEKRTEQWEASVANVCHCVAATTTGSKETIPSDIGREISTEVRDQHERIQDLLQRMKP